MVKLNTFLIVLVYQRKAHFYTVIIGNQGSKFCWFAIDFNADELLFYVVHRMPT